MRSLILLAAVLTFSTGCTATRVRKDPGPHDKGVRYYRPKPFLLVSQAVAPAGSPTPGKVYLTIELKYLPDYSEEYSIHVRAGFGVNETAITLEQGWNLTNLNIKVDSKTNENISALASFAGAIPTFASAPGDAGRRANCVSFTCEGKDVPLGLYEAVVSKDSCGTKRLYGWRYVGFAPFGGCPLESGGVDCTNCKSDELFGLVMVGDCLRFKRLNELGEVKNRPADVASPAVQPEQVPEPKAEKLPTPKPEKPQPLDR